MPDGAKVREQVRARYAEAARSVAAGDTEACGCGPSSCCDGDSNGSFGAGLYSELERASSRTRPGLRASAAATRPRSPICARARSCSTSARAAASTCCSPRGASGRRGQGVRARHDGRDARPGTAQRRARRAPRNVEFLKGQIEAIPLPDASVDVVISNCVINLSSDKPAVLAEAVPRPAARRPFRGLRRRRRPAWTPRRERDMPQ